MLYLLVFYGLLFFEQVNKTLSLLVVELPGPTALEARSKKFTTTLYYRH